MPEKMKTSVRCLANSQPLLVKSATRAYVESIVESLCKEGYGVGDNTYQATFSDKSGKFKPTTKQTPKLKKLKWKKLEQFKVVSRGQDCVFIVHNTNKYMILQMDNAGEAKNLQALVLKANPNMFDDIDKDIGSAAPAKDDKTKEETNRKEVSPPKDYPNSAPKGLPRSVPKSAQSSHRSPSRSRKEPPRSRAMKTSTVQWKGYRAWRGQSQISSKVEEYDPVTRRYYHYKPRASSEISGRQRQADRTYDHWHRSPSSYTRDWSPPCSRYDSNIHVESYSPVDEDSFSSSCSSSPGSMQLGRITCTPVPKGRQTWYKPDMYYHNKMPKVIRERTTYAEDAESDDSTRTPSDRTRKVMELIEQKETSKRRNNRV